VIVAVLIDDVSASSPAAILASIAVLSRAATCAAVVSVEISTAMLPTTTPSPSLSSSKVIAGLILSSIVIVSALPWFAFVSSKMVPLDAVSPPLKLVDACTAAAAAARTIFNAPKGLPSIACQSLPMIGPPDPKSRPPKTSAKRAGLVISTARSTGPRTHSPTMQTSPRKIPVIAAGGLRSLT
jgi:hypothetical protein